MSLTPVSLIVTSRTVPAVPAYCHGHDGWECAAISIDPITGQVVEICHAAVTVRQPWCALHDPAAQAVP